MTPQAHLYISLSYQFPSNCLFNLEFLQRYAYCTEEQFFFLVYFFTEDVPVNF